MPSGVTAMLFAFLELHRVTLKETVLWDSSCLWCLPAVQTHRPLLAADRAGLSKVRFPAPQQFHEIVKKLMQSFANAYGFFGLSQAYWTVCCQVFSTVWCFLCNSLCWNTAQLDCHHQKQDCPDAVLWCSVRVMFSESSPTSGSVIWGEKGRESYPTLISVSLLQWGFIRDQAIRVPALWVYLCDSTRANGYVKWHASNPRSAGHRGGGGRKSAVSQHQRSDDPAQMWSLHSGNAGAGQGFGWVWSKTPKGQCCTSWKWAVQVKKLFSPTCTAFAELFWECTEVLLSPVVVEWL